MSSAAHLPGLSPASNRNNLSKRSRKPSSNQAMRNLLQGLPDFLHVLSADRKILYVSDSCRTVVGYESGQLVNHSVVDFIHPDDVALFTRELHEAMLYATSVRFIYRFRDPRNKWIILESQCRPFALPHLEQGRDSKNIPCCRGLIIMARSYSNKTNTLLDSFLEQKLIYERLSQQIAHLKQEAQAQQKEQAELVCLMPTNSNVDSIPLALRSGDHHKEKAQDMDFTVMGDAGILVHKRVRSENPAITKRNQKRKAYEPHICMFCSTIDSPEWRKGPKGPRTLCNACGLRWSKSLRSSGKIPDMHGLEESE